ncbi:TolC family protein [Bdellovibrionota bacterium FG-1]
MTFAKRNYLPRVSLTSELTYSNSNYLNSSTPFNATNQLSWNALLTFQYNLWDWGIKRHDVQIAEYNRDIQADTLQQGLLETHAQITSMMVDLSRLRYQLKLSEELLSLEEESNQNLESQYRQGKVAYLDLITGLKNLLDAKVQFYTSYFDVLQGIAKYRYFEGKIYEAVSDQ